MFGFCANKLTHLSSDYVDFSQTAILFRSNHHYTKEELIIRGKVILLTAVSGFLCAYLNDEKTTHCSNTTLGITGATLGLMGGHVIFGPSINKRFKMGAECKALAEQIKEEVKVMHDMNVDPLIEKILTLSLATEKNSHASQTWGRRLKLLKNLQRGLQNWDESLLPALQSKDYDKAMELLQNDLTKKIVQVRKF